MYHLFASSLLVLLPFSTFSELVPVSTTEELVFKAYLGDDYIGTMIVSKTEQGTQVDYRAVTDITVTYLVSVDLDFNYQALYREGALYQTGFEYQRNHKLKERCIGQRRGAQFTTQREDEQEVVPYASIEQSLMAAYFQEPSQLNSLFSERWGQNIPLERISSSCYRLTLPDGKQSVMTYRNGLCQESRIISRWGTIVFKR